MLWWIAQNLLIVSVMIVIVSLACRWKRLNPAARHALWLLVLIKLVTPPLVVWPWAVPISTESLTAAPEETALTPEAAAIPVDVQRTDSSGMVEETGDAGGLIVSSETFVVPLETGSGEQASSTETLLLPEMRSRKEAREFTAAYFDRAVFWCGVVWLAGIVLMGCLQGLRIFRMNRLVRRADLAPTWLESLVRETSGLLPVREPRTLVVKGITTPLLWAWGRAVLLWPEALSERLSPEARRGVILHELAHLKRRDHWVGRLELLAGCLWWWNPLFWYVRHQLRENAELACDAWVAERLPDGRRDYAEALLTVCENYVHPAVPLPALGMGKSTRRTLERRLTMILRERVAFRVSWWGVGAVLLLGMLILPGWSQSDATREKESSTAPVAPVELEVEAREEEIGEEAFRPAGGLNDEAASVADGRDYEALAETIASDDERDSVSEQGISAERRLRELEAKLQVLLSELQALRQERKEAGRRERPMEGDFSEAGGTKGPLTAAQVRALKEARKRKTELRSGSGNGGYQPAQQPSEPLASAAGKAEEVVETKTITLQRTTYRISRMTGKTVEEVLRTLIRNEFLQIEHGPIGSDGDYSNPKISSTIIITTTTETQEYIGRLIALIEKAPKKSGDENTIHFLDTLKRETGGNLRERGPDDVGDLVPDKFSRQPKRDE